MQKLAVVYFPQLKTNDIEKLREKYDPGFKIILPHITIVSPIFEISENQLIEHVESTSKDIVSFSIHLTDLIKTSDGHLFLKVKEGNEQIINVHDKLYSGILNPYIPTDFSFEPHITLGFFGMNGDNKLIEEAFVEIEKMNIDVTCNFDCLSIIKGDGLTPAIKLKTITLQKT